MSQSVQSVHLCQSVLNTSYDIVKAHGGELKVVTNENAGTLFTIGLLIQI